MDEIDNPQDVGKRRLALITGAAHRLGKTFAQALARQGYAVVLHYHSSSEDAQVTTGEIKALGVPVFPIQADLTIGSEIHRLFEHLSAVLGRFPGLEFKVLVNSAAIMIHGDVQKITEEEFDQTIAINLKAPFFCAQAAFPLMASGGLIVNITDVAAYKTWTGYPVYTASKAGLESLTKILARSYGPKIRVNSIAPGLVIPSSELPPEEWTRLVRRLPAQRSADLDELGSALEFLLKNEYITGQTIFVDGGYSLL